MSTALDVLDCRLEGRALVEASAGTGKTWAICGLVLRLLLERNLPIGAILVLTFTQAATAELRDRLRTRLVDVRAWLSGEQADDPFIAALVARLDARGIAPPTLKARLDAALAAFDEAPIFTLHAFCQRALGDSPFAAGQPFALELGDSADLIRGTVADYWRLRIAHGSLPPAVLVDLTRRGLSPEALERLLYRRLQKPLAELCWPDPGSAPPALETTALAAAFSQAASCWQATRSAVVDLLLARLADLKFIDADKIAAGARDWDRYFADGEPLAPIPETAAPFCAATLAKKHVRAGRTPPEHAFFAHAQILYTARTALQSRLDAEYLALLRDFLAWAPAEVAARKRARHRVDFDDLLANLHAALLGPDADARGAALAARLRQRYPAALIDEFQDTDPLQLAIFDAIYGDSPAPVFLVGDPKQAIYSFRQADLHTYLAARARVDTHYHLSANQRATAAVIAATNAFFTRNPRAFILDGLDFLPSRRGEKPLPQLKDTSAAPRAAWHVWELPGTASDDNAALLDKSQALAAAARATADEIARLLGAARAGQILVGDLPLRPGRIAVLVRTHRQGRLMRAALAQVGLKTAELAQESVFSSAEAEDLERLLAACLEATRPDLLKAALATPLLGYDAARLAALDQPENEAELAGWFDRLARMARTWQAEGIFAALSALERAQGLAARLLALPDGERRLTNHLHLCECLHAAEAELGQPLRLLAWLAAQRRAPRADEASQLRLESDQDLVGIVTIHKAKGLEYDMVFCPFLWEGGLQPHGDGLPGLAYHSDDGRLLLDFRPEHADAGKACQKREHAAELIRLYYVALTRAVQRVYLVQGAYGKTTAGGQPSRKESARSLLNWLVAGAGHTPADWLDGNATSGQTPAALADAWRAFIAASGASHADLPLAARRAAAPPATPERLLAAHSTRRLFPSWRIESFSGLWRGIGSDDGADHDQLAGLPLVRLADHEASAGEAPQARNASAERAALDEDDVLCFPRGPRAGDCLHHFFQHADFARPQQWPGAARAALAAHPQSLPEGEARLPAMLERLAADVFATRLDLPASPTPFCLADLAPGARRAELEFHLDAPALDTSALAACFAAHGEPLPRLARGRISGFLKGYIDLVFTHAGRYYVLDWKSNHLGWSAADYAPAVLARAMQEHGYLLQARLYLLALHRLLARRLPAYDPERHLGGACYLFVRGVRPGWQCAGVQTGVYPLPPCPAFVLALDDCLG